MILSIIIVNYNGYTLTSNCIRSVIQHTKTVSYEIVLVDNASTECNPEKFLEEFPDIILVKSEKNGGFANGNNLGIKHAKGEYILLLNNDTIFIDDSISKSYEYLKTYPKEGILGCRMIYPDRKVQYTARRFRSISWELLDLFRFIPFLMPYKKRSRIMLGKYFRHDSNTECDWINGAFFLFPKKILEQLDGNKLDERFFMYGEDQLWCLQIKNLGYSILFYCETTIIHIGGGSSDIVSQLHWRKMMMNHELEIIKSRKGRGLYYLTLSFIYISKEFVRNLIKRVVFRINGKLIR